MRRKLSLLFVVGFLGGVLWVGADDEGWIITPSSDGRSIDFTLVVPELEFDSTPAGVVPRISGQATPLRPGAPDVPVVATAVPCEPRGTPSIRIVDTQPEDVTNALVAPAPRWVVDPESPSPVPAPVRARDESLYALSTFWPAELADVKVGMMGTQGFVRIECRPVQYNPVTGTVRVHRRIRGVVEFMDDDFVGKKDVDVP